MGRSRHIERALATSAITSTPDISLPSTSRRGASRVRTGLLQVSEQRYRRLARGGLITNYPKDVPMATLSNRLTRALNIRYPVVSAPMAFAGGGALAAAVSRAGGLGLIGGGYGDPTWLEDQFDATNNQGVGVGFITWSLRKSPSLLTGVLKRRPAAVMLSFGDPRPFVDENSYCTHNFDLPVSKHGSCRGGRGRWC